LLESFGETRQKLYTHRDKRIHPHKDDKILTDWNGLLIGALAKSSRVFGNDIHATAAKKCADFILAEMLDESGHLVHRYRENEASIPGMLCDYAFFVWGLLELYETDFDPRFLDDAIRLNKLMLDLFWDNEFGGFFLSLDDESLIVRPKEVYDGALPSGNSIALLNLLRLEKFTGNTELGAKAGQLIKAFSADIKESPSAYTQFLCGLFFALEPGAQIVIVGDPESSDTAEMITSARRSFAPNNIILHKTPETVNNPLDKPAPFTAPYTAIDNKATTYICKNFQCKNPTCDHEEVAKILEK
jgi:uncharacterized protein YyaL (SSP411 family)